MNRRLQEMTRIGLGIAVVFCGTYFFIIPNQLGGYMNLGDGFILLFSSIVSPLGGFLIGGVGSAIADVVSGYGLYAPFTLVIKGLEGFLVAALIKKTSKKWMLYVVGCLIVIVGYFLVDWFLQGSFVVAITGIPTNIMQTVCGFVIAMCLHKIVIKQANH
ncbi:MAG: ECF transporter S component [Erysipelotrichaceae bacterium]|nr:ECF transporter S component [Erysipelotrichaceae bacterium]